MEMEMESGCHQPTKRAPDLSREDLSMRVTKQALSELVYQNRGLRRDSSEADSHGVMRWGSRSDSQLEMGQPSQAE